MAILGSSLFFISGLRFLPIAEASATGFVAPLLVTALSIVFLGEKVGMRRWIATGVGLIGVLIILRPGTGAFHPAAFFPLVSALAWACTLIMTRMMSGTERVVTTMTYSSIVGLVMLSALVPSVWVTPSWHDIALGVFIGVASTAGQWIVVLAFRYADASVLAPFSYTQLLWVSVLGFLIFGEIPDVYTVTGAAFIVASGLYTAHRERVRRSQLLAVPGELRPQQCLSEFCAEFRRRPQRQPAERRQRADQFLQHHRRHSGRFRLADAGRPDAGLRRTGDRIAAGDLRRHEPVPRR